MPTSPRHLGHSLLLLRLGVGLVMAMWTIDKIINPNHAIGVFSKFYGLGGLEAGAIAGIGWVQAIIVAAFLMGAFRTLSYGAILLMHAASTLSSWRQYAAAFDNLLFFAAWPMLAACVALFLLRRHDHLLSVDNWRQHHRSPPLPSEEPLR